MNRLTLAIVGFASHVFALTACSSGGDGSDAGARGGNGGVNGVSPGGSPSSTGGGAPRAGSPATAGSGATGGDDGIDGGAGGASVDEPYGRFGEPETTFTLPVPSGSAPALYHPDLAADFPDVDFGNLDRLYIPAGSYRTILLGGLPERRPERPLIITNLGGQVRVGGHAQNYVFSIRGGTNWVLTGRYDPVSKTGHSDFRGHAEGSFAHSQGSYGLWIDDAFSKDGLSGLAIGGGASDFELDCFEVTGAEFAGIIAKTDDDGAATMQNVRVHDLYVHDVGSEGIYFGSTQAQPQHAFENLRIYDNRFLRTGTEALQVGQLGSDCEIHNNVLGPAAIRWRSAFARYQDGNVQYGQRYGSSRFHHNVVIGTGDLFVEFFPTRVEGDPRSASDVVEFSDNYFSDTSLGGVYTHAVDTGVTLRFVQNQLRGFHFDYDTVYPDVTAPVQVFGVGSNSPNPHVLTDNVFDAPFPFLKYTFPSVSAANNVEGQVSPVQFVDFMGEELDANYRKLEWWSATATLHPQTPAITYAEGAFVAHRGKLYRARAANTGQVPDSNPDVWEELPAPADDVRLRAGSPHPGVGLRAPR